MESRLFIRVLSRRGDWAGGKGDYYVLYLSGVQAGFGGCYCQPVDIPFRTFYSYKAKVLHVSYNSVKGIDLILGVHTASQFQ